MIKASILIGDWILMPEFKTHKSLVLSSRKLGENSYVVSLFTKEFGKHLGVCKKKSPPATGTFVEGRWQARLPEQMGTYYLENAEPLSALFLDDKKRLACVASVCALLDGVLPERQNVGILFDETMDMLSDLENDDFLSRYVKWEQNLLGTIGFGLDCSGCAGGGDDNDLAYVSPKTGRAVSREKGRPYHDKLLELPAFLWTEQGATSADIQAGLKLTGYFFENYSPLKSLPKVRELLY